MKLGFVNIIHYIYYMEKNIILGNQSIHIYMGWEMMTPKEVVDYSCSSDRVNSGDIIPEEFVKKISNLPDMKRKGAVITTISHDDVFYSDILGYEYSYDSLIHVIEKLHIEHYKQGIEGRNLMYTIQHLLNGGYKYGSESSLPTLPFSLENLWSRVVLATKYYNNN